MALQWILEPEVDLQKSRFEPRDSRNWTPEEKETAPNGSPKFIGRTIWSRFLLLGGPIPGVSRLESGLLEVYFRFQDPLKCHFGGARISSATSPTNPSP